MTPSTAKSIVSMLRYAHSSVFSPSGLLVILVLLGIVPLTWITALATFAIPITSGFTSGVLEGMAEALDKLENEAG